MIVKKITAYMALLHEDGTEPDAASGYARACLGKVNIIDIPQLPYKGQIVFNDVVAPGYGIISDYALYDCPEGGEALFIWELPKPLDAPEKTIPFIHQGRLFLGVDISANVKIRMPVMCDTGEPKGKECSK